MNFKTKKLLWEESRNDDHIFKFYSSSISDIAYYEICYCGIDCDKNEIYQAPFNKNSKLFHIGSFHFVDNAKEMCQKHADEIRFKYINDFIEQEEITKIPRKETISEDEKAEKIKQRVKVITEQKMLECTNNRVSIEDINRSSSILGLRTSI